MNRSLTSLPLALCLTFMACSEQSAGGAPADSEVAAEAALLLDTDAGTPMPTSVSAVQTTATSFAACKTIKPFYWEFGDATHAIVGNSEGCCWKQNTPMEIASASKWLYGAYVLERSDGGLPSAQELPLLNFTSGYVDLTSACIGLTVDQCNQNKGNTQPEDASVGAFYYGSGHLEAHADLYEGLGGERASTLGGKLLAELGNGTGFSLSYVNPLLAGGAYTSAGDYAIFLRKIMSHQLHIADYLGSNSVCTLSSDYASKLFNETCNAQLSPWWPATSGLVADTPDTSLVQNVRYSLAHWLEEDGAFSSPGLYGFYPWIDGKTQYYGIIARQQYVNIYDASVPDDSAYALSVQCGQAMRKAWFSGVAVE